MQDGRCDDYPGSLLPFLLLTLRSFQCRRRSISRITILGRAFPSMLLLLVPLLFRTNRERTERGLVWRKEGAKVRFLPGRSFLSLCMASTVGKCSASIWISAMHCLLSTAMSCTVDCRKPFVCRAPAVYRVLPLSGIIMHAEKLWKDRAWSLSSCHIAYGQRHQLIG